MGVHAKNQKFRFKNGRDPRIGSPISSLLKIRSIELFRSGLPWQIEAVGLENRTHWLDKGCVSENGGPSEKEPVREPPERPELPTVKAMEGWSLRVKFEKCSNGCEWPQKHDTWPLGCWVSEYQPSGPRKRPEKGRKWGFDNEKKFWGTQTGYILSLGWKMGVHAKNQKFWFKNGRDSARVPRPV